MKNNILTFIIGVLVGAIIATAGFLIYNKSVVNTSNQSGMMEMNENEQMEKPSGNMGEPPEKPDGDNGEEPPAKPEETNENTNS